MHAPLALVSALNPHNAPVQFRGALSDLKRSKIHQHKLVVLNLCTAKVPFQLHLITF